MSRPLANLSRRLIRPSRIPLSKVNSSHRIGGNLQFVSSVTTFSQPSLNQAPRISPLQTVLTGLFLLGIGTFSYGLWEVYSALSIWPSELGRDLRAGLRARYANNLEKSEQYLRRALQTSYNLSPSSLEPNAYLKITGIAILLSSVLEDAQKPREAYEVLSEALRRLLSYSPPVTTSHESREKDDKAVWGENGRGLPTPSIQDRLRGVAMAMKLADLAEKHKFGQDAEEQWLVWAVEEVLKIIRDKDLSADVSAPTSSQEQPVDSSPRRDPIDPAASGSRVRPVLAEFDLPEWVSAMDAGAPIEALAAFYAKVGKAEYAVPLYLQAISLLLPPGSIATSPVPLEDRCRAAQFMSNLSAAIVELPPASNPTSAQDGPASENAGMERDMGRVTQAETWAKEAYDVVHAAGVRPAHYYKDGDVSGDDDDVDNGSGESKKEKALPRVEVRNQVCDAALGAILYNVGMLKELSHDYRGASRYYMRTMKHYLSLPDGTAGKTQGFVKAGQGVIRVERRELAKYQHLFDEKGTSVPEGGAQVDDGSQGRENG